MALPSAFEKRVVGALQNQDLSQAGTYSGRLDLVVKEAWAIVDQTSVIGVGVDEYRNASPPRASSSTPTCRRSPNSPPGRPVGLILLTPATAILRRKRHRETPRRLATIGRISLPHAGKRLKPDSRDDGSPSDEADEEGP